jgi:hypothetical protein
MNAAATPVPRVVARRLLSIFAIPMKQSDTSRPNTGPGRESQASRASGITPTLNAILKLAYRRHTRGRVALAAVAACLGR